MVERDPGSASWPLSSGEAVPFGATSTPKRSMDDVVATAETEATAAFLAAKQMKKDQKPVRVQPWTKGHFFNALVNGVVVANGVVMGVEADYSEAEPDVFMTLKHCFAALFLAELVLHVWFEGFREYFTDRANWLDFFLVVTAAFDAWLWSALVGDSGGQSLRLVSLLRLLRLLRLARLVRLFRSFKTLTLLVTGVRHALAGLIWAVVFLVIVVYIFSIFARQIIGQRDACDSDGSQKCDAATRPYFEFLEELGDQQTFFGSIPITMLTLIVCLTEGCGPVVRETICKEPMLLVFWLLFTFTTSVSILQLIVGLFCQTALKDSEDHEMDILESREAARRAAVSSMVDVFRQLDLDGDGEVTRDEFFASLASQPEVIKEFCRHGIDCENLFETLNAERTGSVSFQQFFDGTLLIMKGQEKAKAKDVVGTQLISRNTCRLSNDMRVQLSRTAAQHARDEAVTHEVRSSLEQLSAMSERLNARAFVIGNAVRGLRDGLCDVPATHAPPSCFGGPTSGRGGKDSACVSNEREAANAKDLPSEQVFQHSGSEESPLVERQRQWVAL